MEAAPVGMHKLNTAKRENTQLLSDIMCLSEQCAEEQTQETKTQTESCRDIMSREEICLLCGGIGSVCKRRAQNGESESEEMSSMKEKEERRGR